MSELARSDAVFSPCGVYRYALHRWWDTGGSICTFILLNPSTADATEDDPTIRRCVGYGRAWGYAGITVLNLFAFRSTDPEALKLAMDPVGPDNDEHIRTADDRVGIIVAGWGVHGTLHGRDFRVRVLLRHRLHVLGLTSRGHPKHPLYLKADLKAKRWGTW